MDQLQITLYLLKPYKKLLYYLFHHLQLKFFSSLLMTRFEFYRLESTCCCCCFLLTGRVNENMAPFPSLLFSAHNLPPWDSMILFDMNKPNPVPPVSDLVANFVNNLGNMSGCIPSPLSLILTMTCPSVFTSFALS